MREHSRNHEEQERAERSGRGERRERSHRHEEQERSERRDRGERGERPHRHEEHERVERREQGERTHRHTSWRSSGEEEMREGSRRARVERGMLRYLLLDALHHGPKHGYEMIKWLEDQTYGRYAPSAGTVYPTLQLLEDQELILAERAGEKSVYRLTETGEAELQAHADFTQEFWQQYGQPVPPPSTLLAGEFVYEELQELQRTVEKGVRVFTHQADQQSLLPLRQALERSKNEIRALLVGGSASQLLSTGTGDPQGVSTETRDAQQMSTGTYDDPIDARELEEAIAQVFVTEDEALRQTLFRAREHGLPPIQISALQGKLLQVLAAACQARKILEIGALAGYSGIWLARALPADGRLITLEVDATYAELVRESFRQARVEDRAEVRIGPALETLPRLADEGPFDLIFIDADKAAYPQYLEWAIQLARPGSIIVADNCLRTGEGLPVRETTNPSYTGIRAYNQEASRHPALCSIALPINTGMTISVVLARTEQ